MLGMAASGAVIFDLDDLLIDTYVIYEEANRNCSAVVAAEGLDPVRWEALRADAVMALTITMHVGRAMVPLAAAMGYIRACEETGRTPAPQISAQLMQITSRVFSQQAPLRPGAISTLEELRSDDNALYLLTRGDREIQEARFDATGLRDHFVSVMVVDNKTVASYEALLSRIPVPRDRVWMVGDSLDSDIWPALTAGIGAVWIPQPLAFFHRELDDRALPARFRQLESLRQLPALMRVERLMSDWRRHPGSVDWLAPTRRWEGRLRVDWQRRGAGGVGADGPLGGLAG